MQQSVEVLEISVDDFKARISQLCVKSGLSNFPRKKRDRHILLKSVILGLERTREYTKTEINPLLQGWLSQVGTHYHLDYVNLRRHLIDEEFLSRSKEGSRCWVATSSRNQLHFDPEINEIDIPGLIRNNRELSARRQAIFSRTPKCSKDKPD